MAAQGRQEYESGSYFFRGGLLYDLMSPPMRAIVVNNTLFRSVVVKICMRFTGII